MTSALIVIDVQNALCSGEHAAFDSAGVIERINQLSARAREAGAPVVMVQHQTCGGPLDAGTPGWQLADGLVVADCDHRVDKTATDSFHHTGLQALLQRLGATRLVICGLQSDFCVDTTTRRALALGYPVTLVSDGHSTLDNGLLSAAQISAHHTLTLSNITSFGPRVTPQRADEVRFDARINV